MVNRGISWDEAMERYNVPLTSEVNESIVRMFNAWKIITYLLGSQTSLLYQEGLYHPRTWVYHRLDNGNWSATSKNMDLPHGSWLWDGTIWTETHKPRN